eukprot:COSAG02_NODE_4219_length_5616_cov_20.365779_3_plen_252_part_00
MLTPAGSGPDSGRALLCDLGIYPRIDHLECCDGSLNEIWCLNGAAWLGIGNKPTIMWTYSLLNHTTNQLDEYFQQHLLVGAFPSAPVHGNDHMISPGNSTIEAFYRDYAPLFGALRGARWHLTADGEDVVALLSPHAPIAPREPESNVMSVGSSPPAALLNEFTVGNGTIIIIAVVYGRAAEVDVRLNMLCDKNANVSVSSLRPGDGERWTPLHVRVIASDGAMMATVGFQRERGCALLRLWCGGWAGEGQ